MADTFIKIASVTVGAGGASSIDFTSIPSTYTDLCLKFSGRCDTVDNINITFNGSTTSYTTRYLYGSGSAAASASASTQYVGATNASTYTANAFGNAEIYIPNYAGSNNKSISTDSVQETNVSTVYMVLDAALWSNTAAITSLSLAPSSGKYVQYSTATLYGIKNS